MGATPVFTLPWPELGDLADGPDGYQDLAKAAEAALLGQRDTADDKAYTPTWTADGPLAPSGAQWSGRYAVRTGMCQVWIFGTFTASTSGGKGSLHVGLPVRARSSPSEGLLTTKYWMPGVGAFMGFAVITASSLVCSPYFSTTPTNTVLSRWQSTDNNGAAGSGVPAWSGHASVVNGGNISIIGRYYV